MWAGLPQPMWYLCVNEKKVLLLQGGHSSMQPSLNWMTAPFKPSARCPHVGKPCWSLTAGQNLTCDLSGLTISSHKGFAWQHSQGKLSPPEVHSRYCPLEGLAVKGPSAGYALTHISNFRIPSLGAFTGEEGGQLSCCSDPETLHLPSPSELPGP